MMDGLQIGEGVETASKPDESSDSLQFTDQERQILELYDRLKEIQLEISILRAQESIPPNLAESASDHEIRAAQGALLEAKALYNLRNAIVESVLVANPVLKAVHATGKATAVERDLLPLIQERDSVSVSLTDNSAKILAATEKLTQVEAEHIGVAQRNRELAATMIALAAEAGPQKKEDIQDPAMRQEVAELEEALKISRQRWRIMKGTASAVVAGSGVDWARDEALREMVMETDSD